METLFIYLLKSSFWIAIFGVFYLICLRNTTFFKFNRAFLLLGILLSFLLPLFSISYDIVLSSGFQIIHSAPQIPDVDLNIHSDGLTWVKVFATVYFLGIAVRFTYLMMQYVKLKKLIASGQVSAYEKARIIVTKSIKTPLSFYNYILMPRCSLSQKEQSIILTHELTHINQKHWVDLFCGQLMLALQWFNPLAWIYMFFQKENHELLADDAVLTQGTSAATYQAALLNQQLQYPVFSLSSSFSYINSRKRFRMMKKAKTSHLRKYSLLLLAPVLGAYMWLTASPNYVLDDNIKLNDQIIAINVDKDKILREVIQINMNKDSIKNETLKLNGQIVAINVDKDKILREAMRININKDSINNEYLKLNGRIIGMNIDKDKILKEAMQININKDSINNKSLKLNGEMIAINMDKDKILKEAIQINLNKDSIRNENIKLNGKLIAINIDKDKILKEMEQPKIDKEASKSDINTVVVDKDEAVGIQNPLIIVGGKEMTHSSFSKIDPNNISQMSIFKDNEALDKYGEKGKNGVIVITLKDVANTDVNLSKSDIPLVVETSNKVAIRVDSDSMVSSPDMSGKPFVIVDGKELPYGDLNTISPDDILSISVLKGDNALNAYGIKARDGAIIIALIDKN